MKNLVRYAVVGALMVGGSAAQAQSLPSSGSADLWLFVADPAAQTTFAEDLGSQASLSTLMPTATLAAQPASPTPTLSTAISANFSVGPSSALTAYINAATAAGQTLEWAVDGAQYAGQNTSTAARAPGGILEVTNNVENPAVDGAFSNFILSTIQTTSSGLQGDLGYLTSNNAYAAGGSVYKWKQSGTTTIDVWGQGTGDIGGSTDLYGQGQDQENIALGTTTTLYGLTGNTSKGQVQSYILGTNLTLSSTGTLSIGGSTTPPPPPVPLPAAVWLFGSGLLGLLGVGRRRAAA